MSESTQDPNEGVSLEGPADGGAEGIAGVRDGGADGSADSGWLWGARQRLTTVAQMVEPTAELTGAQIAEPTWR
jgi:hypothetical protein